MNAIMTSGGLTERFQDQRFANGYQLIDGVQMSAENGDRFQIPHPLLKKYVRVGQFVELRVDSPRFSSTPMPPSGAPVRCVKGRPPNRFSVMSTRPRYCPCPPSRFRRAAGVKTSGFK